MRVLSLFSGGGLGDYGLEKAGFEIVGQVEIDEYCQKILALRWPNVPKWRDVRSIRGADLPSCDLISGGFPCQDISAAGKGAGITGERSGLWKEMFRIIREVRPRYVLVENVTALLGRGLGTVLGDLAQIGYDAEWDCIPASAIGAPHQRDRIWIVAYARYGSGGNERASERGQNQTQKRALNNSSPCRSGEQPQDVADTERNGIRSGFCEGQPTKKRRRRSGNSGSSGEFTHAASSRLEGNKPTIFPRQQNGLSAECRWWKSEPNVGRVAHGVAKRVDRLKLLGNGQVVQVVEYIGRRIIEFDKGVKWES